MAIPLSSITGRSAKSIFITPSSTIFSIYLLSQLVPWLVRVLYLAEFLTLSPLKCLSPSGAHLSGCCLRQRSGTLSGEVWASAIAGLGPEQQ